jgi:hypothetical protein
VCDIWNRVWMSIKDHRFGNFMLRYSNQLVCDTFLNYQMMTYLFTEN